MGSRKVAGAVALTAALALVAAGCGGDEVDWSLDGGAAAAFPTVPGASDGSSPLADGTGATGAAGEGGDGVSGDVVVDAGASGDPLPADLLGINVPAWLSPDLLGAADVADRIAALGPSVIRMPGGSWSTSYDWLGCETGTDACVFTGALRPSDYLDLLDRTGATGMWTVSINGTAQEAAALVAFFRGDVGDDREIGTDREGVDWGTVGQWAQLRVDNGHPDPAPITSYEIGNEVYGAVASAGPDCASFGWETVWTCDGTEYVNGTDEHDGFLAYAFSMKAVDPDIRIGLVGTGDPDAWSDFGAEALAASGDLADFYIVHDYPFDDSPSTDEAMSAASSTWPGLAAAIEQVAGREIDVAVTEYNLVTFQDGDTERTMATATNLLFLADTIGQMASSGIDAANFWNLANGRGATGTDYGLLHAEDGSRAPSYYALALWSRMGSTLVPVASPFDDDEVALYASRAGDGSVRLLVVNKTDSAATMDVRLDGAEPTGATLAAAAATDPADEVVRFNGEADPANDLADPAPAELDVADGIVAVSVAPWSVSLVTIET